MRSEVLALFDENVKIHFAGNNGAAAQSIALRCAGVKYSLYTVYDYIAKKSLDDDLSLPKNNSLPYDNVYDRHMIQDSGLFTLMFGAGRGNKQTKESLQNWQDKLIKFVMQNKLSSTCVEIDCQKVLGVK